MDSVQRRANALNSRNNQYEYSEGYRKAARNMSIQRPNGGLPNNASDVRDRNAARLNRAVVNMLNGIQADKADSERRVREQMAQWERTRNKSATASKGNANT